MSSRARSPSISGRTTTRRGSRRACAPRSTRSAWQRNELPLCSGRRGIDHPAAATHGFAFMPGIDESKPFVSLRIAVLTVSDTRSIDDDKSGATLAERIAKAGHKVAARAIVRDDVENIRAQVQAWIADPDSDVIISTGGTGFTGRDGTPEAVEPLFEKKMEGFATLFLMVSQAKIGTSAIQTRATAGVAGGTYIFCLQIG